MFEAPAIWWAIVEFWAISQDWFQPQKSLQGVIQLFNCLFVFHLCKQFIRKAFAVPWNHGMRRITCHLFQQHPRICTKDSPIKYHSGFWFIEETCKMSCWELLENARDTWSHFYLLTCFRLSMRDKDCHWDYIDFSFNSCLKYLLTLRLPSVFVGWESLTAEACVVKSNYSPSIPNCGKRESGNLIRWEQSVSQCGMLIHQKG